jgi:hypothetical protein
MKREATVLLFPLALALCASAHAQPAPAAPPSTAADTPKAAAPYKSVEPRQVTDYPLPSSVDPRVCLEFPTTAQIIACAEKYRPGKRRT